jgi:hypothetical protein
LKASGVELEKKAEVVSLHDPSGNVIRLVGGDASALPETQVPAKVAAED